VTLGDQARFERRGQRSQRQAHAQLVGQADGDAEVLAVERQLEAERVVVVDHPTAAVCEHP
jgi:hypothetical protein